MPRPTAKLSDTSTGLDSDARMETARGAIAAKVLAMRRELNLSQIELARKLGLSSAFISKIEHGTITPSLDVMILLAQGLGITLSSLFSGLDEEVACKHVLAKDGLPVDRAGTKHNFKYRLRAHTLFANGQTEFYHISCFEDSSPFLSVQSGTVFLQMLSGRMNYRHGKRTFDLRPGDTLLFDASCLNGPGRVIDYPISYLLWRQVLESPVAIKSTGAEAWRKPVAI